MKYTVAIFALLIMWPGLSVAGLLNGTQFGLGVSLTSGINASVGYHNPASTSCWARYFGVRLDVANTGSVKSAVDSVADAIMGDGIDVGDGVRIHDGKIDAWNSSVLLDWYPLQGVWRLSGGYYWGNMNMAAAISGSVVGAPTQRFYFYLAGDHYYYNGNNFSGNTQIDWRYHGPYLGTGFDIGIYRGLKMFIDMGVVFTNRPAQITIHIPHEQLYIYNKTTGNWAPVTIPQLDSDVARATNDGNRKLSDFKYYPVVKLGLLYRF